MSELVTIAFVAAGIIGWVKWWYLRKRSSLTIVTDFHVRGGDNYSRTFKLTFRHDARDDTYLIQVDGRHLISKGYNIIDSTEQEHDNANR